MTDKEKAIVMAYTGVCMLAGEKFPIYHKYVEDILERKVFTHEMADKAVAEEIKQKSKNDFLNLCKEGAEEEQIMDLVSREAVNKLLHRQREMQSYVNQLPAYAGVVRKVGVWIEKDGWDGDVYYDCSACGESWTTIEGTPWDNGMNYCPHCGAKMEGE